MSKEILSTKGEKLGEITLNEGVFEVEPNLHVMHLALRRQLNNARQGSASAKTRAEVSGGGRKPWKQKGTGRARAGSTRSPLFAGGGVSFGPKPRDYSYRLNKKERRLAIRSVLSSKVLENNLVVVDAMNFDAIKTKNMVSALSNLKVEGKTLIVLPEKNENVQKSARNIEGVKTSLVNTINVYDLLKYNKLILTVDAVKNLEEVYA